jgi:hypothetical protein
MGRNFNEGDSVIAVASLGHGVNPGSNGIITHVSTFHGLVTVRFENGAEIQGVKMEQVEHG